MNDSPAPGKRAPKSTATQPSTANIAIRECLTSASLIQSIVLIFVRAVGSGQMSGTTCSLQSFYRYDSIRQRQLEYDTILHQAIEMIGPEDRNLHLQAIYRRVREVGREKVQILIAHSDGQIDVRGLWISERR